SRRGATDKKWEDSRMSQAALDRFGHLLMTKVRDESISEWNMIVTGKMKGERVMKLRQLIERLSDTERHVFLSLVPEVVDSVLHHLLWMFEQEQSVRIGVVTDTEDVQSLNDLSDGLSGELYSDEGWIARFSRENE